jgi:hypothetical protein
MSKSYARTDTLALFVSAMTLANELAITATDACVSQQGDVSQFCQRTGFMNVLSEVDHTLSGTQASDMKPGDESQLTDVEKDYHNNAFDKSEFINNIDSVIAKLEALKEEVKSR